MEAPKILKRFGEYMSSKTDAEKAYILGSVLLGFGLLASRLGELYDDEPEPIDITDSTIVEVVDE